MTEDNRRICAGCGQDKHLSRYPKRGRGRSRICRVCMEAGVEVEVKDLVDSDTAAWAGATGTSSTSTEVAVQVDSGLIESDQEASTVPSKQITQVLLVAKDLRRTARELRAYAREYLPEGKIDWVDAVPARMLDTAAVQLELLCQ